MDMSQISRNRHFSGIKAPQGATRHRGAFQKLTSIELIHFYGQNQKWVFPGNSKFGNVLPCQEEKKNENQNGPYGP